MAESKSGDTQSNNAEVDVSCPESNSVTDKNPSHGAISKSSARQIIFTEKGLEWRIDQEKKKLRSLYSTWRVQCNDVWVLLSDSSDQDKLRSARDQLCKFYVELGDCYAKLGRLIDVSSFDPQLYDKMDLVGQEHSKVLQSISCHLLQQSKDESTSQISAHSRASNWSKHSNASRRSDSLLKAAELKAKLKYIDLEAKAKADLEKIQTMQKLHIEEAKLSVLEMEENTDMKPNPDLPLPKVDAREFVENYLNAHADSPDQAVACPTCLASDTPAKSKPTVSSFQVKPIVTSVDSLKPKGLSLPSAGLNPTAASFTPQVSFVTTAATSHMPSANTTVLPDKTTEPTNPSLTFSASNPVSQIVNETPVGNSARSDVSEITKTFAEQLQLSRLPPPEPGIFAGDPLKYPAWKSAFEILIESKQVPNCERLYYLKRYVSGQVRDVIDGYLLLSSADAYNDARKLLDERYGNPFTIACAFRDKLDKWPKIGNRDAQGLVQFSDFLRQCLNASHSVPSLSVLNDSFENRKLLVKLPEWLVTRWNRIVVEKRDYSHTFPLFKDFVDFINKEAKIASDPVTSLVSLKGVGSSINDPKPVNRGPQRQNPVRGRTLLTESECKSSINVASKSVCVVCKKSHDVESCKMFLRKSLDERKSFLKEKGLCFGCLSEGHISKYCKKRRKCNKCSKFHPSCLHIGQNVDTNKESNGVLRSDNQNTAVASNDKGSHSGSSFFNRSTSTSLCSMVVPVYLSHRDTPSNERLVYALLDTQSDTTFALESTCQALGLSGADVKLSLSTMFAENKVVDSQRIQGLMVRGINSDEKVSLPDTYTRSIIPANRSHIPTPEMANSWPHLQELADHLMPCTDNEVGLLIGYNCPAALVPLEVLASVDDGPYGQRTRLGWGIVGVVSTCSDENDLIGASHHMLTQEVPADVSLQGSHFVSFAFKTCVREIKSSDVLRSMERDFCDLDSDDDAYSQEDKRFLNLLENCVLFKNGHYEMPLPFKSTDVILPDNKSVAQRRLELLKRRLTKNQRFAGHYREFMEDLFHKGYAEKVSNAQEISSDGRLWYLPHHGVYHPHKPDRIRVVFDCSSTFKGESLNSHLLQGPDLTNKLVGVICRFRKEPIAIMCDVEQMFYQFSVRPEHRDYLRFLWWENSDFQLEPSEYRMTVHLFGATSSPGCANFGLKRIARDFESEIGSEAANFLCRDFYVDDGLKSLPSVQEAIDLIDKSKLMCSRAGLRLHKFASNAKEVLEHLDPGDRAKELRELDLNHDTLPIERALGVLWCIESDEFRFRIVLRDCPLTRRGILSTVSSLYDPLGLISPVVLLGKLILQQMCADKLDWDEPLQDELRVKWSQWRESLKDLSDIRVRRCLKPDGFGQVASVELHHFSDASTVGYAQCSYVRLTNQRRDIHCSLLMGKSRVAPLKPVTVPRLELSAAVLSVKIAFFLERELDYNQVSHVFWSDSKIVLSYINNEARRFHVFVANRVQQIREKTETSQWRYVSSEENPSDTASRGAYAKDLVKGSWFEAPDFLWKPDLPVFDNVISAVSTDDPELKRSQSFQVSIGSIVFTSISKRFEYFSDWHRLKKAVALCLKYKRILRSRAKGPVSLIGVDKVQIKPQKVAVEELRSAELEVLKVTQKEHFSDEIKMLMSKATIGSGRSRSRDWMLRASPLRKLDPFLDAQGVLRVGGRIDKASLPDNLKHPVILPRKSHVTNLVVQYFHIQVAHQGRGLTTNALRAAGFWVLGCSSAVKYLVSKCVICRKFRFASQGQKMADLPVDRLEPAPPFAYCAVDLFGPFYIKEGRKELKRYGALFTCLLCRAVHVETCNSLETDSFINCLRRFISLRGPVRHLRSDRGTNFVGAENEMREAVNELDEDKIKEFLLKQGCDMVEFKMNVPAASHMGGVWERQIRSVRSVLVFLLQNHGNQLDDESLRTFLHEAAAIVNSRPLSVENVNDPLSLVPLSANHLLTMKSSLILPPPGNFQRSDLYLRKRWRRVQYLANQFWIRWRSEFLQNLQIRNKWTSPKRNVCEGDIVLVVDENQARNHWRLGRVVETFADDDGLVRKVKVALASANLDAKGKRKDSVVHLERPIHKIVILQESEDVPVKEPDNDS